LLDPVTRLNLALKDRYRILRELGVGGTATVYLADDLKHHRKVAVKVPHPELVVAVGSERFLREIETTAGMRHPHVLPLYDSGDADGLLYYVMPFVEGSSLRARMDQERQLPLDDALRLIGEVAEALIYAHGRGVIHRDVKPGNILLENGRAVVADFGIAHPMAPSGDGKLTRTGAIVGTPSYMSPEQANGEPLDARSDLYALGCVAYEMLAGTPPFVGPSGFVVMARHALDPVPPLRTVRPEIPASVADLVERALAKSPADRFASIADWHRELVRHATGSPNAGGSVAGSPADSVSLGFSSPERPSIAILPFKNLGSDAELSFLADGIRLGIQATLVQLSGLFLVNASTLNIYRDADLSAMSVGRELAVRYVMEGAVQQSGQRLRVTVQMTDVDAGQTIWAERYDRAVDDIFELQDHITGEVISSLNVRLVQGEVTRGLFGKLTSPEAREYFYRGSSYLYGGTEEDNAAARRMFTELFRVEPDSVVGPSMIALTHWIDALAGWSDPPARSKEKAADWASRAMQYEDNNGIGHAVYGHLRLLDHAYDEALAICTEGVRLRPSCPVAHGLLGLVLNYSGDARAAVHELREALHLERVYPVWLLTALAIAYRDRGDVGRSMSAAKESLRLDPTGREAALVLCSGHQLAGEVDRARHVADEVVDNDPTFRLSAYAESHPYRDAATLEHVLQSLRQAGLPE
jgi:serine/threonine protein kinase/tetratricopeptide (TPR) repeat protein